MAASPADAAEKAARQVRRCLAAPNSDQVVTSVGARPQYGVTRFKLTERQPDCARLELGRVGADHHSARMVAEKLSQGVSETRAEILTLLSEHWNLEAESPGPTVGRCASGARKKQEGSGAIAEPVELGKTVADERRLEARGARRSERRNEPGLRPAGKRRT